MSDTLFDRNELRRLEKAVLDKNKIAIFEWASQFEKQIRNQFTIQYDKKFDEELDEAISRFLIAIVYTLHFNEKCGFGTKRIKDVLDDILATIERFKNGECTPEDYMNELKADNVYYKQE